MAPSLTTVSANKHFEGTLTKYKFKSSTLGDTEAAFNVFLPANAAAAKVPVLIYLAGLTCTEDNGAQKGSFMKDAAQEGIALVFPDTSPRGAGIAGEDDSWDFGSGAGFYVNATHPAWAKHYNMRAYVTQELPAVIEAAGIPIDWSRQSIFGHSMGGHGALTLYLQSFLPAAAGPGPKEKQYRSASAFSPICNPTIAPWGTKAFGGYLKDGVDEAQNIYDATQLISRVKENVHILIDYGTADNFLFQLNPDNFLKAARESGHDDVQVRVRSQEGYDHSYYFISTFASDHIHFHANFLKA